jgi:hypothetical protein
VYGRKYRDKELRFEPSGGLMHSSLVMQDKETDSYWSIMTGDSLAGELKGTPLEELPVGVKAQWKDWFAAHPDTLVLSVEGREHEDVNPYDNYFSSAEGFRGMTATDDRLPTKTPIYAFQLDGDPYAVPFSSFEDGGTFKVGERTVFLYRPKGAVLFHSSVAYVTSGVVRRSEGSWRTQGGAVFDIDSGSFTGEGAGSVDRLDGFDTFWFNWSLTHPATRVLERAGS